MSALSGFLLVDNHTGAVSAVPGRINEFDLDTTAERVAPPGGTTELWVPYRHSAFGDSAVCVRRVSGKQMRADAEALSGTHGDNRSLAGALDDAGYTHVVHWDCDLGRRRTARKLSEYGASYALAGVAQ